MINNIYIIEGDKSLIDLYMSNQKINFPKKFYGDECVSAISGFNNFSIFGSSTYLLINPPTESLKLIKDKLSTINFPIYIIYQDESTADGRSALVKEVKQLGNYNKLESVIYYDKTGFNKLLNTICKTLKISLEEESIEYIFNNLETKLVKNKATNKTENILCFDILYSELKKVKILSEDGIIKYDTILNACILEREINLWDSVESIFTSKFGDLIIMMNEFNISNDNSQIVWVLLNYSEFLLLVKSLIEKGLVTSQIIESVNKNKWSKKFMNQNWEMPEKTYTPTYSAPFKTQKAIELAKKVSVEKINAIYYNLLILAEELQGSINNSDIAIIDFCLKCCSK